MKRYLVTGGAGFIGSNYIHYLLETYQDSIEVHNVDCLTYAGNLANLTKVEQSSQYFFHKVDICDSKSLKDVFDQVKPDIVVHFAAESHVDRSILGSKAFIETNVLGTQSLLDLALSHQVARFVHVSTDEVYGSLGKTGAFTETHHIQPNSPYSASKAGSDLLVRSYVETHQLPAVITRCSNNYGPYQFPEKLIPLMVTNAMYDIPLPVYGKGDNIRDWIHVLDHCKGIQAVAEKGKVGEVYNLGGDAEWQNIDIVKSILSSLGKSESLITYVTDRPGHDFRYAMDFTKAKTELGWQPEYSFDQGLEETIAWYVENETWWQTIKSGAYRDYYETQYQGR